MGKKCTCVMPAVEEKTPSLDITVDAAVEKVAAIGTASGPTFEELITNVNDWIAEGWQPYGDVQRAVSDEKEPGRRVSYLILLMAKWEPIE